MPCFFHATDEHARQGATYKEFVKLSAPIRSGPVFHCHCLGTQTLPVQQEADAALAPRPLEIALIFQFCSTSRRRSVRESLAQNLVSS